MYFAVCRPIVRTHDCESCNAGASPVRQPVLRRASWSGRHPVTVKIMGSSPIRSVARNVLRYKVSQDRRDWVIYVDIKPSYKICPAYFSRLA